MATRVDVNIDLLTWAISRAGYDMLEFTTSFPQIDKWLSKEKQPTVKQLEQFSKKVNLPFGYLFLDKPPLEETPFPFFRTGKKETFKVSLNVYDTILILQKRQEWLREYLKDNEFSALDFVGKFSVEDDYLEIANDIRHHLGIDLDWAFNLKDSAAALNFLISKLEELRIFASFSSVVGNNNRRKIDIDECRGFVLVDEFAPFVFVNAADPKSAQLFTLAHELAHIWTGTSAGFDFRRLEPANNPIEKLCDLVSAEFLVPQKLFESIWKKDSNIIKVAKAFKVSPIVIGRRAMDLGKITKGSFFKFYGAYIKKLNKINKKKATGGNFYGTAKLKINASFIGFVNTAIQQNQLLYRDAYDLTGLKGNTYNNFVKEHL